METTPWAAIYIDKCARPSMYPVTLRCERSEPRRATAPAPRPYPSRAASRPPQDDGSLGRRLDRVFLQQRHLQRAEQEGQRHHAEHLEIDPDIGRGVAPDNFIEN